jgi:hypothetical protein
VVLARLPRMRAVRELMTPLFAYRPARRPGGKRLVITASHPTAGAPWWAMRGTRYRKPPIAKYRARA